MSLALGNARPVAGARSERLKWGLVIVLGLVALLLRFNAGLGRDLWEDEVIAAMHAEQPFWRLPVEVVRDDVHPFLYFLQLHAWWLLGRGDFWLRLNSVCWNLCAIASLFFVVRRLYGARPAIAASLLFAVSAPAVWMAQELRPYSWLYCLLIWAFYFMETGFRPAESPLRDRLAAFALCLAIIYSHAVGFVAVLLLGVYALGRIVEQGASRRMLTQWVVLFALAAIAAVPVLAVGLLRDANLSPGHGIAQIAAWFPQLLLPRGDIPPVMIAAALLYFAVALLGIAFAETRLMALLLVLGPMILAVALNLVGMEIFKVNVFGTFILPFFMIVTARLLARLEERPTWLATGGLAVLLVGSSLLFFADRTPTTGFRAAARLIEAEARPGDVVYVPQPSMFGGMARYLGTGRLGWQLEVAPPLNEQWRRMYARLPRWFIQFFELEPKTQTLETRSGLPMVVGNDSIPLLSGAHRVWLVYYERNDLPAHYPPGMINSLHPAPAKEIGFLHIALYE